MQYSCRLFFLDSVLFLFFVTSLVISGSAVQGQSTCPASRYHCANDKCIPGNWQCDGEDDCGDASDERDCEARTCSGVQFECHSGDQCIPIRWKCDGDSDCHDGSDETPEGCIGSTCPSDYFTCGGEESPCIPNTWVCDLEPDCDNGQDEADCNLLTCPPEEFKCHDNSQCISLRWMCDHDHDCADGSDEAECPDTTCATDYFMCNSTSHCIPDGWRCDGDADCEDASDEIGCATPAESEVCGEGLFRCRNGDCIHDSWKCDREDDCGDNSDEDRSICPEATCPPDQYTCGNGHCVPGDSRCNDRNDCEDGSDEMGCPTPPVVVQPEATSPAPRPENQCSAGYTLTDVGCVDIDECLDRTHPVCSHECTNTEGSFICHCRGNYRLVNHTYCKALGDPAWIVYIYHNAIRKFNLGTLENLEIYGGLPKPLVLDMDYRSGKIFWSDSKLGKIMMGDFEGRSPPRALIEGVGVVDGLAYDWIHRNIYWTDTHHNTTNVASVDTGKRRVLFSEGLDEPRAIVVDPRNGYIYWTDWGTDPKIEKAAMDGSWRETIFHRGKTTIEWPNGLTIDYTTDRLYWVDGKHHVLMSSDLSGKDFHVVLHDAMVLQHPFQLTVFQDEVYWTDWDTDSVRRANKFTGEQVTDVVQQLSRATPIGLRIWHENVQPAGENYCDTALAVHCSHLAVAAPERRIFKKSDRCSCLCPVGIPLLSDRVTCKGSTPVYQPTTNIPERFTGPAVHGDDGDSDDNPSNDSIKTSPANSLSLVWIIILVVVIICIILVVMAVFLLKKKASGGKRSMNFDNPVYRKTTEDQLFLSTGTTYEHNKGSSSFTPMIPTDTGNM